MLRVLSIENFALIHHLEVEFENGLNLITGETGSGKSILVDSVALLVGERASQEMVREGFDRASVEGIFNLDSNNPACDRLLYAGIPVSDGEVVVRREITRSGSNKIYINGHLSTLGFLSEIGSLVADIHGQHDQQALLTPTTHLSNLDAFGQNGDLCEQVAQAFQELRSVKQLLQSLEQSESQRLQKLDALRFQIGDIKRLQLTPGLHQQLEHERDLLTSAERRQHLAAFGYQLLYEKEGSGVSLVDQTQKHLEDLSVLDPDLQPLAAKLLDLRYQLEEVAYAMRDYADGVRWNSGRLDEVEERLAEIQKACRKYAANVEEILGYYEEIVAEESQISNSEQQTEELTQQQHLLEEQYLQLARQLSRKRHADADKLNQRVESELADLAMEKTIFRVGIATDETEQTEQGIDLAEFLISPNPGESPKALARVASGGELSRVILALKSIVSVENYPKTLVFDEVDAGIGGRVATNVGAKLAGIAVQDQVFCVTHWPQLASFAGRHFHVAKKVKQQRTVVNIRSLKDPERVDELARMMAGDAITETTRKQARELLTHAEAETATAEHGDPTLTPTPQSSS